MTTLESMRRATALAVCLLVTASAPLRSAPAGGTLAGRVVDAETAAPLIGARVHLAAPDRPEERVSNPTDASGTFAIDGVAEGPFMLGVELEGRLHVVPAPLSVAPGETREVDVQVQRSVVSVAPAAGGSVWSRPLYASLIIVGGAIVLGLLLDQALDEDVPVSPSGVN